MLPQIRSFLCQKGFIRSIDKKGKIDSVKQIRQNLLSLIGAPSATVISKLRDNFKTYCESNQTINLNDLRKDVKETENALQISTLTFPITGKHIRALLCNSTVPVDDVTKDLISNGLFANTLTGHVSDNNSIHAESSFFMVSACARHCMNNVKHPVKNLCEEISRVFDFYLIALTADDKKVIKARLERSFYAWLKVSLMTCGSDDSKEATLENMFGKPFIGRWPVDSCLHDIFTEPIEWRPIVSSNRSTYSERNDEDGKKLVVPYVHEVTLPKASFTESNITLLWDSLAKIDMDQHPIVLIFPKLPVDKDNSSTAVPSESSYNEHTASSSSGCSDTLFDCMIAMKNAKTGQPMIVFLDMTSEAADKRHNITSRNSEHRRNQCIDALPEEGRRYKQTRHVIETAAAVAAREAVVVVEKGSSKAANTNSLRDALLCPSSSTYISSKNDDTDLQQQRWAYIYLTPTAPHSIGIRNASVGRLTTALTLTSVVFATGGAAWLVGGTGSYLFVPAAIAGIAAMTTGVLADKALNVVVGREYEPGTAAFTVDEVVQLYDNNGLDGSVFGPLGGVFQFLHSMKEEKEED